MMGRTVFILSFFFLCLSMMSCVSQKRSSLSDFFHDQGPFHQHFAGFALFDPDREKYIYEYNGEKYFTPASNTKILTLFAALTHLEDSIVTAAVQKKQDTLFIWGLGDPTWLSPNFPKHKSLVERIRQDSLPHLVICQNHYQDQRFGSGWAWDDFQYGYQLEKSSLPVFGNRIMLRLDSATQSIALHPGSVDVLSHPGQPFSVQRQEHINRLDISYPQKLPSWSGTIPLRQSADFLTHTFSSIFDARVSISDRCPQLALEELFYSTPVDTVYRRLMHQSDNFIAEQLLLQISALQLGSMHTGAIIERLIERDFSWSPDPLHWHDGSGLSRYNMFTPRSLVSVLHRLYQLVPMERLRYIFPAGGLNGTIKDFYASDVPFVYAKTGTLRNKHCLSGYLFTDAGHTLIFSFMHNNFSGSSLSTKSGMDRVLRYIKSHY